MKTLLKELKKKYSYDEHTGLFTRLTSSGGTRIGSIVTTEHNEGYITIGINKTNHKAHRLAWLYHYGEIPDGILDHINQDKTDNRISNLRVVNDSINSKNCKMSKHNKTGFNGVSWSNSRGKYIARIKYEYKEIWLGQFDKLEDAINARKLANIKYGFHQNHGKQ